MDRINIIDELTNLYIKYAESCNDVLDSLGYYEQLENYRPSKKLFPWKKRKMRIHLSQFHYAGRDHFHSEGQ